MKLLWYKDIFSFLQTSSNSFSITKQPMALLYIEKAYPHIPSVDHSHPTLTQLLCTAFVSCFSCSIPLVQPRAPLMGLTRSILFALCPDIMYLGDDTICWLKGWFKSLHGRSLWLLIEFLILESWFLILVSCQNFCKSIVQRYKALFLETQWHTINEVESNRNVSYEHRDHVSFFWYQ